jgi:hypothetical protein
MGARMISRGRLATARVLTSVLVLGFGVAALAQAPPAHMDLIIGQTSTTPSQLGEQNLLALNVAKFGFYDRALRLYRQRLLEQHPVILGLFSSAGGDFTLYRPGMAPLRAPTVPVAYQVLKSVSHSPWQSSRSSDPRSTIARTSPGAPSWKSIASSTRPRSTP